MKVSDFTEETKVNDGIFYLSHKIRTKGAGKAGKILPKYIFCDIIDPYLKLWLEYRENNGIVSPWLFVTYKDGNYECATISTANSFVSTIKRESGIEIYAHCFRHAWTTRLHKKNYPESVI